MDVEGEAVDFPEVDTDGKDEATLRDFVAEEVLVPTVGAPPTGWRVDRFPQGMRLVSTPLWSLKPPTCEPELWLIIGKAAQSEMRAKWQAGGASYLDRVPLAMDTPVYRVPLQFEQFMMTLLYRVMVVSWLSVFAVAALPALRLSYSKLEHRL